MPFPLAHPAAVLPLRRIKCFDFAALVIGSITPDLAYLSGPLRLEEFSHSVAGTFAFCLPVGLLVLWLFRRLTLATPQLVPTSSPPVADSSLGLRLRSLAVVLLSILVGAWTHILWDSFTHKSGWIVRRLPALQVPVASLLGHQIRIFHLLWYGCSFAGVAWLYVAYERWKQGNQPAAAAPRVSSATLGRALVAGMLAVLLGAIHHLFPKRQILYAGGLAVAILLIGLIVWIGKEEKAA